MDKRCQQEEIPLENINFQNINGRREIKGKEYPPSHSGTLNPPQAFLVEFKRTAIP